MSDFLPTNYKIPLVTDGYAKLHKGTQKFRVLSSAVIGMEFWKSEDGKRRPVRRHMNETISLDELEVNEKGDAVMPKHFWAFVVWNYEEKRVQILQITQKGIQKAIKAYVDNEDYGNPSGYDISVTREGDGFETEYTVIASPPKVTPPEALKAYGETKINLEALFAGGDPFAN